MKNYNAKIRVCPNLSRTEMLNSVIKLPIKINCRRISLLLKIKNYLCLKLLKKNVEAFRIILWLGIW